MQASAPGALQAQPGCLRGELAQASRRGRGCRGPGRSSSPDDASGPGGSGGSLPPLAPPSAQITQSLLLSVHSWGTLLVSLVTLTGHGAQGTLLGLTLQVGHRPKAPRPLLTRGWG